ncbi:MAG: sporulation protein [Confluentimicrobium sp.]|uniref:SPOR domain-containing protein n=1 Tax=Actibacterium sp. TaxID=1872125 RepID=UPI000C46D2F0|nr:SPOR domain-containing protein [Actibacterium sp.]MBC57904.1 sporulation protein [Actibacterium sp.]
MADFEYDDLDEQAPPEPRRAVQAVINWAGALTSVVLVVGLAIWGYRLTVRDVSGVPVVRALEGPLRVAPEDPGGRQARHQGLAVNDVAAEGGATPPADRLVLAPRPVDLTDEDAPRAELARPEPTVAEPATPTGTVAAPDPVASALVIAELLAEANAPAVPEPGADLAEIIAPGDAEGDEDPSEPVSASAARSPHPAMRPRIDLAARAAVAAAASAFTSDEPEEIAASAVPPGAHLVQLGAYDSPEVARAEWQRLSSRFASFMEGKQRLVQSAVSGGRTFYRLRAVGFTDISDARRFCAALTAEKADCIPVVAR